MKATLVLITALFPRMLMAQPGLNDLGGPIGNAASDGFAFADPGLSGGRFLIALVTGVALAYCFQWLLTNLSVAAGVSALQGVTDAGKRDRARRKAGEKAERNRESGKSPSGDTEPDAWEDKAVKIGSGIGIWAMATSSIALFLAAWLALELIRYRDNFEAIILGLVIWSVFMGTMIYLESSAAASLLGLVAKTARGGVAAALAPFRAAAEKLTESRAQSSEREQAVRTAEEIAAAVRKEMFGEDEGREEGPGVVDKVRDYVASNVKPKAVDVANMGREVKALLTDPELIGLAKRGELGTLDKSHFAEIVAGRTDLDKEQVERMADTLHSTWLKFLGENAPEPTRMAAEPGRGISPAMATAGGGSGSPQGIMAGYKRFKEFLRSTGREELKPERIEQEIKTLLLDPKEGLTQIREHAKELDRESLVQALGHREDMTPEEANRIVDQIDMARGKILSAKEEAEHRTEEVKNRTMARIRDHVYAMNRPEPDYEGFKGDFRKLLDDPKAGYDSLKNRLKGLDRETLVAVLTSTGKGMSREDAEKLVDKGAIVKDQAERATEKVKTGVDNVANRVLEAKEAVLERARAVEEETRRRMEDAKRISLEQAEAARKVTAAAAWWLLAIAIVSGIAAALGGLTAAGT
jgi:hypothetical protein